MVQSRSVLSQNKIDPVTICIERIRLRFLAAALVVCASLALPTNAKAQVAIGATVGKSTQESGASDSPYLGPGFGGTSAASVILVDVDVAPTVSVGGELSMARNISGLQRQRVSGGDNEFLARHHDTLIYGVVKVKAGIARDSQIAAVGGFGFALRHTQREGIFRSSSRPGVTNPMSETLSDPALAATVGADAVFLMSRHVGILALARVHILIDKDRTQDGPVYRGVSSVILRYGIGMRVRF